MKNQFDILNRIQNKDNYKEEKLSKEEKQAIVNRVSKKIKLKNNKKSYKKIAVAVLCCILIGSTLITNEQVLAAINNKIGKTIESFFGKNEEVIKDYKKDILKEVEDKGIRFIVNEAAVDDDEILISATIDYSRFNYEKFNIRSNRGLKIKPDGRVNFDITQNGEKKEVRECGLTSEKPNNKTVNMLCTAKINNPNSKDNYTVDLSINKMEVDIENNTFESLLGINNQDKYIEGNWHLTVDVNNKDNVKTYNVNKKIDLVYKGENIGIDFKDIRISPLLLKIRYTFTETGGDKMVRFKIVDENGNIIHGGNGGGGPTGVEFTYIPNKNMKSIKLIPIIQMATGSEQEEYYEDNAISVQLD